MDGFPALDGGDVRKRIVDPGWRPPLLSVMGTEDHCGVGETRAVREHRYAAPPARRNLRPSRAPDQNKVFVEVEGVGHPGAHTATLSQWRGLWPLLQEVIDVAIQRVRR